MNNNKEQNNENNFVNRSNGEEHTSGDSNKLKQERPETIKPQIGIQLQYVKDLSFENPGSPESLTKSQESPDIQINVEVQARPLGDDNYEVLLHITANSKSGKTTLFILELTYGAICKIIGVSEESLEPVLLVECPRLIFPFARRILSDATKDGGFPPLMLNPIDFMSLYKQQKSSSDNKIEN